MKKHNPIDIRVIAEQDNSLEHVIICDLDGTIALNYQNRSYYGDKCAEGIKYDTPFSPVISLLKNSGLPIIFVTGRHGNIDVVNETIEWIKSQGLKIYKIYFRKEKDNRNDAIVKKEIYERNIKNKYFVEFVLDDRNSVVKMWRSLGLLCLQVWDGDF